jgi:hypothetical protein
MTRFFGIIVVLFGFLSFISDTVKPFSSAYATSPYGDEFCRFEGEGLTFLGHIGGTPKTIERTNGYTFLATGPELLVIDDQNPNAPIIVERKIFPFNISDIAIFEDKIAVLYRSFAPSGCPGGFWLGTIQSEGAVTTIGEVLMERPTSVSIDSNFAYITTNDVELKIYDIASLDAPNLVGSLGITSSAGDTAIANGILAISHGNHGIHLYSLEDPLAPVMVGGYAFEYGLDGIDLYGTTALLYGFGNIDVLDISTPSTPVPVRRLTVGLTVEKTWLRDNYLYYSGRSCNSDSGTTTCYGEVKRLNLVNPSEPTMTYRLNSAGTFTLDANLLFLTDSHGGYKILTESSTWLETGGFALPGYVSGVTVANNSLWIDGGNGRVQGLQPIFPFCQVGLLELPLQYANMTMTTNGNYIYITRATRAGDVFQVIRTEEPSNPSLVGEFSIPSTLSNITDVAVDGNYAYWLTHQFLRVVDLANPSQPDVVGQLQYPLGTLAHYGDFVYAGNSGFQIIDVSNPTSPALRGGMTNETRAILATNGRVYGASNFYLIVYDVTNPDQPTILGEVGSLPQNPKSMVRLDSSHIAILYDSGTIKIIDVGSPSQPTVTAEWVGVAGADEMFITPNGYLYVAANDAGLYVFRYSSPQIASGTERVYLPFVSRTSTQSPVGCP